VWAAVTQGRQELDQRQTHESAIGGAQRCRPCPCSPSLSAKALRPNQPIQGAWIFDTHAEARRVVGPGATAASVEAAGSDDCPASGGVALQGVGTGASSLSHFFVVSWIQRNPDRSTEADYAAETTSSGHNAEGCPERCPEPAADGDLPPCFC
jgi:hypothetical protein